MPLSDRTLNRTLWLRQQLVPEHRDPRLADAVPMVQHLLGLQAQESLAPYLSLAARIDAFDPHALSDAIAARSVVRLLTMRSTVHVLAAIDALALRPWVQPALDRASGSNQGSRAARDVTTEVLDAAVRAALNSGPLPVAELAAQLAERLPQVPAGALRSAVRDRAPLVQVPPRGLWRRSGGVVYEHLETWLHAELTTADPVELVRRYLRAYGPASAADMTAWSSVTRLGSVFASMGDELVEYTDVRGRTLFDLADGVLADPELELPVVLLGNYDNLWLSHADRSRIATAERRRQWTGPNGGIGAGVFVDGMLEGAWNRRNGEVTVTPFRRFTKREQAGVDREIARIRAFVDS